MLCTCSLLSSSRLFSRLLSSTATETHCTRLLMPHHVTFRIFLGLRLSRLSMRKPFQGASPPHCSVSLVFVRVNQALFVSECCVRISVPQEPTCRLPLHSLYTMGHDTLGTRCSRVFAAILLASCSASRKCADGGPVSDGSVDGLSSPTPSWCITLAKLQSMR